MTEDERASHTNSHGLWSFLDTAQVERICAAMERIRSANAYFRKEVEILRPGAHGDRSAVSRLLIRSMFAHIEAQTWGVRQITLLCPSGLSDVERLALRDASIQVRDNGEVRERTQSLSRARSVRLAFRLAASTWAAGFELNVGGEGWAAFQAAGEVRNRITHPQAPSDMEVTPAELDLCRDAYNWLTESVLELFAVAAANAEAARDEQLRNLG